MSNFALGIFGWKLRISRFQESTYPRLEVPLNKVEQILFLPLQKEIMGILKAFLIIDLV